ncbi:major histocompatibility complex class I-related gene protein-like [Trachinotus anak]|uniref:major histocompatibility complex class I-related gene protein-like n=1 Tax=Trachinotus anak TaxID=443729 RepID=UPI0039F1FAEB
MRKIFVLLLLCLGSSSVKHSLQYFFTASSGVQSLPEGVAVVQVDNITAGSCDASTETLEPKHDWVKNYLDDDPQQQQWYTTECFKKQPQSFRATIDLVKQDFNLSGGVHILQRISGCEWDDETGEVTGLMQYGYNGEDFISLNLTTLTWTALKPQADVIKQRWDADKGRIKYLNNFFSQICPDWLKKSLNYGRSSLLRTDLPSVSLLQKSPSSSVSCHATGFYPDRALMLWRKDGEDLHEDVDQGEILPNHDGSFQMRVDLDLSSVKPEDWGRYECVFQLSGVKEEIITKLDKAEIRSNSEKPTDMTVPITATVVVVALVIIAVTIFMVYKKKNRFTAAGVDPQCVSDLTAPVNAATLSTKLNPET